MKNKKKKIILAGVLTLIIWMIGVFFLKNQLTYIENAYSSYEEGTPVEISSSEQQIVQEFISPYDIVKKAQIKIGTYGKDNNSKWQIRLEDMSGKAIASKDIVFIDATDNAWYTIDFQKNVALMRNEKYRFVIIPLEVDVGSKIAFYMSKNADGDLSETKLWIGSNADGHVLNLNLQGGERDLWWIAWITIALVVLFIAYIRVIYLEVKGLNWQDDVWLQALFVCIIVLAILFPCMDMRVNSSFVDENDNIRGGMLIAKGAVLYKDYVVQHTPFTYYLCALFSLLGAHSVAQMRFMFYVLIAVCWGVMFLRYYKVFGRKIMALLSVLSTVILLVINGQKAATILSDIISAMCMLFLVLEYLVYLKDKQLRWDRCMVISITAWICFGSTFISAYGIAILFLGFAVHEISIWKEKIHSIKDICKRYGILILLCIIPPIIVIGYFYLNGALVDAYRQIYLFNRQIYPVYQHVGGNIIEPFFAGIVSVSVQFKNSILALFGTETFTIANFAIVLVLGIFVAVSAMLLYKDKHNLKKILFFFWLMCTSATRGFEGYHGISFWPICVALILIWCKKLQVLKNIKQIWIILTGICLVILLNPVVENYSALIKRDEISVTKDETMVMHYSGDCKKIFLDAGVMDSIYLLDKGYVPAQRASYIYPWYMDWYENWCVDDLVNNKPEVVVWYKDMLVWDRQYFCNKIAEYINENYEQLKTSEIIWVKK